MKKVEALYVLIMVIILPHSLMGKSVEEEEIVEQIKVGNFALPVSQQPGPLIGFGQNLPGKGVLQTFFYYDQLKGVRSDFKSVLPSILYGILDRLSIFAQFPIAAKFTIDQFSSHGLQDFVVQFEGAAFLKETPTTVNEITLVANMSVPTGSSSDNPITGFGAPTFFLGFTAGRTTPRWYYFTAMGGTITTSHHGTKFGNQFTYQFGLGGNILYSSDKYIFNWLVELDGIYVQRAKIAGMTAPDTGGNRVVLGPSLWFSTRHFFAQIGVSGIIAEHLFGNNIHKEKYIFETGIGLTF